MTKQRTKVCRSCQKTHPLEYFMSEGGAPYKTCNTCREPAPDPNLPVLQGLRAWAKNSVASQQQLR